MRSPPEQRAGKLHAALDADEAELDRARAAVGLASKEDALGAADAAEEEALSAFARTVPTTKAGIIAAIEYAAGFGQYFWTTEVRGFLITIVSALKTLA